MLPYFPNNNSYLELILFISELLILLLPLFLDFFQLPIITSLTLEHLKMFLCFLYKYISFSYSDIDLGIEFVATTFSFQSDKISFILCGRKEIWKKKKTFFAFVGHFCLGQLEIFFSLFCSTIYQDMSKYDSPFIEFCLVLMEFFQL